MRTFALTVVVLVAADVLLSAPASRLSTVFNRPTHWLAAWMDPRQPLIPQGALATSSAGSGPAGSTPVGGGSQAVKPKMPGHCPPGYLWDSSSGTCLRELG